MDAAWRELLEHGGGEHIVQLYDHPDDLTEAVEHWLAAPLRRGGGALMLGPSTFGAHMRERLSKVDPAAEKEGRLLILDGDRMLQHFVRDGAFDRDTFGRLVGDLIARMRRAGADPEIRAWGAMVDTLARRGQLELARELEVAWNGVIESQRIRLLCSYEMRPHDAKARERIAHDAHETHTHLHRHGPRDT